MIGIRARCGYLLGARLNYPETSTSQQQNERQRQNKLQKLEDALLKHMLTAADLAGRGDINDRGNMGERRQERHA